MFCEKCGRQLQVGEVCHCQDVKQKEYQREANNQYRSFGADENRSEKKQKMTGFNGKVVIAWMLVLAAVVCFAFFNFKGDAFFEKVQFLQPIRIFFSNILTLFILMIGLIFAILSLKKQKMRTGGIVAVIMSLVLILGTGGYFAWNIVENNKVQELFSREVSADNVDELEAYYEKLDDNEKNKFSERITAKVVSIQNDYINEKVDSENALAQLKELKTMKAVTAKVDEAEQLIANVEKSRESFAAAQEYEKANDTVNAMNSYAQVIKEDTKYYDSAQSKVEELKANYKTDVVDKINSLSSEEKYDEAMQLLEEGMAILPNDSDMSTLKSNIQNQYIDSILTQANSMTEQKNFAGAIELLTSANNMVKSTQFQNKLIELDKYKNVSWMDLTLMDAKQFDKVEKEDVTMDVFGNIYNNAFSFENDKIDPISYAYFNTDGRYKMFSGLIVSKENSVLKVKDKDNTYRVEIYADDQLVYTSPALTKTSQPEKFEVEINYAKVLQVKVIHLVDEFSADIRGLIAEGQLYN